MDVRFRRAVRTGVAIGNFIAGGLGALAALLLLESLRFTPGVVETSDTRTRASGLPVAAAVMWPRMVPFGADDAAGA